MTTSYFQLSPNGYCAQRNDLMSKRQALQLSEGFRFTGVSHYWTHNNGPSMTPRPLSSVAFVVGDRGPPRDLPPPRNTSLAAFEVGGLVPQEAVRDDYVEVIGAGDLLASDGIDIAGRSAFDLTIHLRLAVPGDTHVGVLLHV